ncbi:hypothetical protein SAMN04489712_14314 [Thermomonospora echinospora]|uniref:Winged helix DNA-binding domain-containing protein n=1 Tax=Thermomonospora echinospora TaxID=1992 RepID=A0A1H6EB11_9ACTN|nr:hypothetical protein [Thermomonospora echinospora]SEG94116.1 hypothetical protein SAMN04489712_14314 [Thermomonospora echinospora]
MTSSPRSYEKELDGIERALESALEAVRGVPREGLTAAQWLEAAAELGRLQADAREASGRVRQALLGSARTALLAYLRAHAGQPVEADALEGVAAIQAWTRRIRELRIPFGWQVESGTWSADMQKDQYRLVADQLGEEVSRDEEVIKAIKGKTSKERILEYLLHLSPWPASPQQLERVAGAPTWRQDIRELIEEGWLIRSHEEDQDLAPGFYRLAKLEE